MDLFITTGPLRKEVPRPVFRFGYGSGSRRHPLDRLTKAVVGTLTITARPNAKSGRYRGSKGRESSMVVIASRAPHGGFAPDPRACRYGPSDWLLRSRRS